MVLTEPVVDDDGSLDLLRVPGVLGVLLLLAVVGEDVDGLAVMSVLLFLCGVSTLTNLPKPGKSVLLNIYPGLLGLILGSLGSSSPPSMSATMSMTHN